VFTECSGHCLGETPGAQQAVERRRDVPSVVRTGGERPQAAATGEVRTAK
jgi:hypothetical protein